jgi:hypothetical protein
MTTMVAMTATTSPTGTSAATTGCRVRNDVREDACLPDGFVRREADRVVAAPFDGRLDVGRVGPGLDFDIGEFSLVGQRAAAVRARR